MEQRPKNNLGSARFAAVLCRQRKFYHKEHKETIGERFAAEASINHYNAAIQLTLWIAAVSAALFLPPRTTFPRLSTYNLSTIDFYSNSGLITYMETENNKTTAKNRSHKKRRPSVWERFMTIYTCLLPIVVWIVIVVHFLFVKHRMFCECFGIFLPLPVFLPCSLYFLSAYISLYLIPIILGIIIYDPNMKYMKAANSEKSRRIMIWRICNQFHDSFIGEIIHIFLYFVMLGILLLCILYTDRFGLAYVICCAGINYYVPIVIAIITFYVLIRRLSIYYARRIRIYKRQKDKRKETLERIRKNRQDTPPVPPEEENWGK